eukprot:3517477-Rhodomonas_salina.6
MGDRVAWWRVLGAAWLLAEPAHPPSNPNPEQETLDPRLSYRNLQVFALEPDGPKPQPRTLDPCLPGNPGTGPAGKLRDSDSGRLRAATLQVEALRTAST